MLALLKRSQKVVLFAIYELVTDGNSDTTIPCAIASYFIFLTKRKITDWVVKHGRNKANWAKLFG